MSRPLTTKDQAGAQPELGTRPGELAAMVRVDTRASDDCRRAHVEGLAEEILELPHFVAAERKARQIIPLHEDRGPAQGAAEARRGLERGRQLREWYTRQPFDRRTQVADLPPTRVRVLARPEP